jgi:succinoglycan biosynthesis protein ExoO
MMPKSVAVIIPAFNVASCISTAVHSALSQSLAPLEIIVVDDASTDDTASIVADIAREHKSVRLILMPHNRGAAAARNVGLDHCSSDWIAILDSDDRYLPKRLEYLVAAAEEKQLDLAADNYYNYDVVANKIVGVAIPPEMIGTCLPLDRYDFVRNCMTNMAGAVDLGLLKPIMRRSFVERSGLRYLDDIRHGEDFIFYLTALVRRAKFAVFPEPHYVYTQRLGSVSGKHSALTRTRVDLSEIEAESRRIAASTLTDNDPQLAQLLNLRADRMRAAKKFFAFRTAVTEGHWIQAAHQAFADKEVRSCASEALAYKFKKRWHSLLNPSH